MGIPSPDELEELCKVAVRVVIFGAILVFVIGAVIGVSIQWAL